MLVTSQSAHVPLSVRNDIWWYFRRIGNLFDGLSRVASISLSWQTQAAVPFIRAPCWKIHRLHRLASLRTKVLYVSVRLCKALHLGLGKKRNRSHSHKNVILVHTSLRHTSSPYRLPGLPQGSQSRQRLHRRWK